MVTGYTLGGCFTIDASASIAQPPRVYPVTTVACSLSITCSSGPDIFELQEPQYSEISSLTCVVILHI